MKETGLGTDSRLKARSYFKTGIREGEVAAEPPISGFAARREPHPAGAEMHCLFFILPILVVFPVIVVPVVFFLFDFDPLFILDAFLVVL